MQNDINIDKILERQQNGNVYILHIMANQQFLSIEIQDKMKGDIWIGEFGLEQIQEITLKAKNPKKYTVFIKMLMSSLLGQTESVLIEILTYAQLERKMNLASRGRNIQNNKKYMIMTYMSEFDKAHYPLPLNFQQSPPVDRLKMTIKRLSQQLQLNGQQKGSRIIGSQAKEVAMLKYENQSLKARIKNLQQKVLLFSQQGQNMMDRSNLLSESKQTKKQLENLKSLLTSKDLQIDKLKTQISQLTEESIKKENQIIDLKQLLNKQKLARVDSSEQQQTFSLLEEKINQMNKQTTELVSELQHAKEKEKKNLLKIENLEKQLEKMMGLKQTKNVGNSIRNALNNLGQSRQSNDARSEKSFTSQKSQKSNKSNTSKSKLQTSLNTRPLYGQNTKKPISASKRSSVYDSDTQSSKLRKATNSKVSPFRQTSSKPQKSNSSKRAANNFTSTMTNRFERNILTNNRDRSRSKSRSVKKENSPPAQIPTDNFASSSEDQRNITEALTKLKQRKNRVKVNDEAKDKEKIKDSMQPLERKINNIAEMLRKAKSRQGRD